MSQLDGLGAVQSSVGSAQFYTLFPGVPRYYSSVMRPSLLAYYLGTPVFAVLDFALGLNVRAVFLPNAAARTAYYLASVGCGLLAWRRPGLGPIVGMAESGINVLLLALGILVPVWDTMQALGSEGAAPVTVSPVLTPEGMVNAALSGLVFVVSFYGNQAALTARRR